MRAWLLLALLLGGCGVRLDETPEPAPAPSSPSECRASPMTSRIPANVGSSQLIEGWPSLK